MEDGGPQLVMIEVNQPRPIRLVHRAQVELERTIELQPPFLREPRIVGRQHVHDLRFEESRTGHGDAAQGPFCCVRGMVVFEALQDLGEQLGDGFRKIRQSPLHGVAIAA